jgi:hypothetical protein
MKAAVIFSVPTSTARGAAWSWRSEDHTQDSAHSFPSHAECAIDAQRNGYTVGMDRMAVRSDLIGGKGA